MPRIVIPDDEPSVIELSAAATMLAGSDVRFYSTRPSSPADLLERIRDAECVINVRASTPFNREVLQNCPRLRLISIWGTGTDNIDLEAAREHGICVTNTPGVSAISIAEHVLMLALALARNIINVDRAVRRGEWPRAMASQLHGKTLGLIGTGAIGKAVARLGKGIGCRVVAWTFHPAGDVAEWLSLDDVFRQSDVLSIHVRLSAETNGMIGSEQFELMKRSAIVINTARGAIINQNDLLKALQASRIAGAGLDVFDQEPLPPDSPLFALPNVILTPHSAGITPETAEAGIALAIDNIFRFLAGNPANCVVAI